MKNWKSFLIAKLTVEEYALQVRTQEEKLGFRVRYLKHSGLTTIEMAVTDRTLPHHVNFATYLQIKNPVRAGKIYFGREKKVVSWAVQTIADAYEAWRLDYQRVSEILKQNG